MMTAAFLGWPAPNEGQSMESWHAARCAVCGRKADYLRRQRLHLDHDHETGFVRGYLCPRCNHLEAVSEHPVWQSWRAGGNPATAHGWAEVYINIWGDTPMRYTAVDEDELRAAVNLLGDAS